MNTKLIKYAAIFQVIFGIAVVIHNIFLINFLQKAEPLQTAGIGDGILITLLAIVYLLALMPGSHSR